MYSRVPRLFVRADSYRGGSLNDYMSAHSESSSKQDIKPFARFIAESLARENALRLQVAAAINASAVPAAKTIRAPAKRVPS